MLGFGLWMKLCPTITQYLLVVNIEATDPLLDYAALVFIVVGAAAVVISLIGCCGALKANQALLFVVSTGTSHYFIAQMQVIISLVVIFLFYFVLFGEKQLLLFYGPL